MRWRHQWPDGTLPLDLGRSGSPSDGADGVRPRDRGRSVPPASLADSLLLSFALWPCVVNGATPMRLVMLRSVISLSSDCIVDLCCLTSSTFDLSSYNLFSFVVASILCISLRRYFVSCCIGKPTQRQLGHEDMRNRTVCRRHSVGNMILVQRVILREIQRRQEQYFSMHLQPGITTSTAQQPSACHNKNGVGMNLKQLSIT